MVRTGAWLSEAWEIFKQDPLMHILACVVISIASGATGGFILIGPLTCGYYYMILKKMREPAEAMNFGDIAKGFEVFVPALVASLLISVFASVGAIACFVGSIVVAALLMFTYLLVMDQKLDFWPAIQGSFDKTKGNWLGFSLFALALLGINLVGILLCGLGILVTAPVTMIATVVAYRDNFPAQAAEIAESPSIPEPPSV